MEASNQPKLRRSLPWELVKKIEDCAVEWGLGGKIAWLCMTLELFAEDGGESSRCRLPEERENCVFLRGPTVVWEQGGRGDKGGGKVQDKRCDNSEESGPGAS